MNSTARWRGASNGRFCYKRQNTSGEESMRLLRVVLIALAAIGMPALAAAADNYPNRPIKLIVPFPAGGPNDIIARVVADKMSSILGQTIEIGRASCRERG